MTPSLNNLCFRCGRGCSGLSASFDAAGKLLCPACASSRGAVVDDNGTFAVLPADTAPRTRAPCPFCSSPLPVGAISCPACHKIPSVYEVARERDPKSLDAAPQPCTTCGYDLRGLPSQRCPECGTELARARRTHDHEETSREVFRNEVRRPLILGVIALGLVLIVIAIAKGPTQSMLFVAWFPVRVAAAAGAFLLCGALGLGIDPPLWLIGLRMAAIIPTVCLVQEVCGATRLPGIGVVGFVGGTLVFGFLLTEFFDLELSDSWLVVLANSAVWLVLQLLIFYLL